MTRQQFITYVEAGQKAFRRFLLALCCGDAALADDIAQEAYIKAFLAMGSLEDLDKFKSWLYRIGYNTFISFRRTDRPSVTYDQIPAPEAADAADDSFRYQALYAALEKIPERERTSILLFYLEGYSTQEIADITNASCEAVRQHLSRGRQHLRSILTHEL